LAHPVYILCFNAPLSTPNFAMLFSSERTKNMGRSGGEKNYRDILVTLIQNHSENEPLSPRLEWTMRQMSTVIWRRGKAGR